MSSGTGGSTGPGAHTVGVVAGLAALLVGVVLIAFTLVFILTTRAAKAQRLRSQRRDFGGRYSDFGFLLGIVGGRQRTRRSRDEHEPPSS